MKVCIVTLTLLCLPYGAQAVRVTQDELSAFLDEENASVQVTEQNATMPEAMVAVPEEAIKALAEAAPAMADVINHMADLRYQTWQELGSTVKAMLKRATTHKQVVLLWLADSGGHVKLYNKHDIFKAVSAWHQSGMTTGHAYRGEVDWDAGESCRAWTNVLPTYAEDHYKVMYYNTVYYFTKEAGWLESGINFDEELESWQKAFNGASALDAFKERK